MIRRMTRKTFAAVLWAWSLWATGSTFEFLDLMPTWPFLAAGIGIATWILWSRPAAADRLKAGATPQGLGSSHEMR